MAAGSRADGDGATSRRRLHPEAVISGRVRIVKVPLLPGVKVYDHELRPVAGARGAVVSGTSTAPTLPPPASVAVPLTVSGWPTETVAPSAGEEMFDVGAAVSLLAVAGARSDCSVAGCAPMSANRLTVAWRTASSAVLDGPPEWLLSRPQDHCTVPAPKTRAPLGRGTSSGGGSLCPRVGAAVVLEVVDAAFSSSREPDQAGWPEPVVRALVPFVAQNP